MKRVIFSLVSILPFTLAACGGSGDTGGDCTASAGANKAQYVVNAVMVPQQRQDYAIDLNGDARVDNQLGNIIGALTGQGLKVQDGVDMALAEGSLILLMGESSADASFQSDSCASTTLQLGKSTAPTPPDFTGAGQFTIDSSQAGGTFSGPIKAGKFASASPATTKHPVSLTIQLPLVAGSMPISLKVIGAHIQYTRDASGKITGGQLNGAIKTEDVQTGIIPSVAGLLSDKLMNDMPPTSTDTQIQSLFDNGGKADPACADGTCKNPDGSCAVKGDNKIDICEVSTASIIQNVLAADVQMLDASGNYAPNKANTMKDSLSVGLSFTAVKASF
jgi:hypothetical protein